ncbi:MAG: 2,3-diketo-5-methylthiopentyl-1-phosphate enolase [Bacilli bacterium]
MQGVVATYEYWDPKHAPEQKAEQIALGMTIGSWTTLSHTEQALLKKHKADVLYIKNYGLDDRYAALYGTQATRAVARIFFPSANFTAEWSAIIATVFGKLSLDGAIRLVDLELLGSIADRFPGPQFGVEAIREKLGVWDRPLTMSIFKGVLGQSTAQIVDALEAQARGGIDLVKDDEIFFENEEAPFEARIVEARKRLDAVYAETGHRTLYAVNVSGDIFTLLRRAERAKELGADVLLFNVWSYGLDVLLALRAVGLPIMAHPAVAGSFGSAPFHGIGYGLALGKLVRLSGADFSLFPSPYGSVALPKEETTQIHTALNNDLYGVKRTWSVPSAGIHPGLVPQLMRDFGTDCIINAGGGIHGHPHGTTAGAKAFRDAIDYVLRDGHLDNVREADAPALAVALAKWNN